VGGGRGGESRRPGGSPRSRVPGPREHRRGAGGRADAPGRRRMGSAARAGRGPAGVRGH
ncbi:MAG: hypothetical protein AVDCRST_MAG89-2635, partial [uncultured Gemmatimonadetes bacterium]